MSNKLIKVRDNSSQKENIGVQFYSLCAKIFIVCALGSLLLLVFVSILPQDYEKYNVSLFFGVWFGISLIVLGLGTVILLLCVKSKKFQNWAEKDVLGFAEHHLKKKIGKKF